MSVLSKAKLQFENFSAARNKLIEYLDEPIQNDRDKAGIIQAFEFTFEQCWKLMQKRAEDVGENAPGPKPAFEIALRYSWIDSQDEQSWLSMLKDRNLTTHTYRAKMADQILERIIKQYRKCFEKISL